MIDTLQLGEIQGRHHGTFSDGRWWWNSRGYTPAGVEAWFGIRALDYLCSRPEVDKERIGMTGRSGGGSYTWTVAALDERVKVAAPIAGMTDLRNQVVDGGIEGHCDCMFFLNTYRWDFPQVAALLAPRPLLIGNSDKDNLFPLDGVVRLYNETRRIYQLYGKTNQLGLLITEGPHADTQDLQLPVFRWFNRFLKGQDPLIEMAATRLLPAGPTPGLRQAARGRGEHEDRRDLRAEGRAAQASQQRGGGQATAGGLPRRLAHPSVRGLAERQSPRPSRPPARHATQSGLRGRNLYRSTASPDVSLDLLVLHDPKVKRPEQVLLTVLDAASWTNSPAKQLWLGGGSAESTAVLRQEMQSRKLALAFFAPRGVEPGKWLSDPKKAIHIRRRYMLLGQTLDGMRTWDIRCAAQAVKALPEFKKTPLHVRAQGPMAVNAAYAALFQPEITKLELKAVPASQAEGPDYLNVLRVWDLPQLWTTLGERAEVENP